MGLNDNFFVHQILKKKFKTFLSMMSKVEEFSHNSTCLKFFSDKNI